MKKSTALPVTTARGQLFELVEAVLNGEREEVELTLRSHTERVVLLRKSVLDRMHADLDELRSSLGVEPRPLGGLGTLNADPGDVLTRRRETQAALAARKRRELTARRPPGG